jgi:16S rRNA (uracil1498-N3)-methyltransferase
MKAQAGYTPRVYLDSQLNAGMTVALEEAAAHHVLRVLRLRAGDAVTLFDGRGGEWRGEIVSAHREHVAVRAQEWRDVERESPLAVTLVQGVSSGERMDFTVQKAVELGVAAIQPVLTEKGVVRLAGERSAARVAHWRRVAISACEQSGRNRVPEIRDIVPLERYCAATDDPRPRLLLSPRTDRGVREAAGEIRAALTLAVGPESGFRDSEEEMLERAGFGRVRIGPRVLRTETAALAALAALSALRGDF